MKVDPAYWNKYTTRAAGRIDRAMSEESPPIAWCALFILANEGEWEARDEDRVNWDTELVRFAEKPDAVREIPTVAPVTPQLWAEALSNGRMPLSPGEREDAHELAVKIGGIVDSFYPAALALTMYKLARRSKMVASNPDMIPVMKALADPYGDKLGTPVGLLEVSEGHSHPL